MNMNIAPASSFSGTVQVPGDKSITHRALIMSCMANGLSEITGALTAGDCSSTIHCLQLLGADVQVLGPGHIRITGKGRWGFSEPVQVLDAGNSGTTMRLLLGVLAGQKFTSFLSGDDSLRQRPMGRVTGPLQQMGAQIVGRCADNMAPLAIRGTDLQPLNDYAIPIASAQVKSALLLAGCYSNGTHSIREQFLTRDHTENLLIAMGVSLHRHNLDIAMAGGQDLSPACIRVPGDFSAAAFLIAGALLIPDSVLKIEKVGLNPTRTGFLETVQKMGAKISVTNEDYWNGERVGDITVESSVLQGINIGRDQIPALIDELPILAVLAAFAEGETMISGAEELRYKESDRIQAITRELQKMGADISETADGFRVCGKENLLGSVMYSHHDHRIAMALAIAALRAGTPSVIEAAECISISFPEFQQTIERLI